MLTLNQWPVQGQLTFTSGGLEMLFSDQRKHQLTIPSHDDNGGPSNMTFLIQHLCKHVMKDKRQEMFLLDGHVYVVHLTSCY